MSREEPVQSKGRSAPTPLRPVNRRAVGRLLFLVAALIAFVLSVFLWFSDYRSEAIFVGLWVPSLLSLGAFYLVSGRQL